MHYIKINTLYKRNETNGKIIIDDFSKEEFCNIKLWYVSEKVNGTNLRISYDRKSNIKFDGKTDNASIPAKLYAYLQNKFTLELMQKVFPLDESKDAIIKTPEVILFGEGVGAKIKGSGNYLKGDVGVILFDVYIDGWWLSQENVANIAGKLDILYAPSFGIMTIEDAINLVKSKPMSLISSVPQIIEGIVARSHPLMLFRDHTPIIWKLKVVDFSTT